MRIVFLRRLPLYFHTARHLTARQLRYQLARRLRPQGMGSESTHWRVEGLYDDRVRPILDPDSDADLAVARADEVLDGTFRFLNRGAHFSIPDWTVRHISHLWSYQLQYQDYTLDLVRAHIRTGDDRYLDRFVELTTSWVRSTNGRVGDGWEPYPLSIRAANWLRGIALIQDALPTADLRILLASLSEQLATLESRIEWHIGGNHVLKNLHTLTLARLLAPTAGGRDRLDLLWREIRRQVLSDGGHYERSPMYHAIALCDLLELIAFMQSRSQKPPQDISVLTRKMYNAWLRMTDLRGRPALLNDSVHSGAPSSARIDELASLAIGAPGAHSSNAWALPTTGYYGYISSARGVRINIDCGEVGAVEQPGHAHCDMLSFELDMSGRPVVVDSGVHGYDGDELREYVRSTRAHSTVMIEAAEQSEMWATFRVARRARPRRATWNVRNDCYEFTGECSPYHNRRAVHRRQVVGSDLRWTIRDTVRGAVGRRLQSFIHLHPDFYMRRAGASIAAEAADLSIGIEPFGVDAIILHRGASSPVQGWYCPDFGVALAAPVIELVVARNRGNAFGYTIHAQHS